MTNPYIRFIRDIESAHSQARKIQFTPDPAPRGTGPVVLMFSPHPDDESITGLLPLRLRRESNMCVTNVSVTAGSNESRREARLAELAAACRVLGFESTEIQKGGLTEIVPETPHKNPEYWESAVSKVTGILDRTQPKIVFFPHAGDRHPTHVGTHLLVRDALSKMDGFQTLIVETEFWCPMDDPNLMVEAEVDTLATLVAATSLHVGEVARNSYHLLLPAWMQDNVRRGAELIHSMGSPAPDIAFATLYRIGRWQDRTWTPVLSSGQHLPANMNLLEKIEEWTNGSSR